MKSIRRGWLGSEIFTRRTATVTISAPDASTAAAFSWRLLYLPVPTIRREVKLRPATVQLSACTDWGAFTNLCPCEGRAPAPAKESGVLPSQEHRPYSTPSDEMDDLEGVAVGYAHLAQRRTRDDLE